MLCARFFFFFSTHQPKLVDEISAVFSSQDAEWARVSTATNNTYLCRAVIVTCPSHLAGQFTSLGLIHSPNENFAEAGVEQIGSFLSSQERVKKQTSNLLSLRRGLRQTYLKSGLKVEKWL